ncbi:MAG TPA: NAD(P)-binding domain-containing protein, partial [Candidatus Bathyarchaeia archaeon]|nr:NAD(P)-binding domain-containing protein [Candidatus Bathyarchaeia archaeon]
MARNLAAGGFRVLAYDVAEPARWASPPIEPARSAAAVAQGTEIVLMSLPDAAAVRGALNEVLAAAARRVKVVIDLSTIGVTAAREFAARLDAAGIAYVDAPVSGGVSGA